MDGVPIEKIKFIINELHYNIKMKGTMVFIILQTSCKDDMEIFNIVSGVCSIIGLFISLYTANKIYKITISNRTNYRVKQNNNQAINSNIAGRDINDPANK